MMPSKPPPPMKSTRLVHVVGIRTSKASSLGSSPRTTQASGTEPAAGTRAAFVIVAASNGLFRRALQAASAVVADSPVARSLPPQDASTREAAAGMRRERTKALGPTLCAPLCTRPAELVGVVLIRAMLSPCVTLVMSRSSQRQPLNPQQ